MGRTREELEERLAELRAQALQGPPKTFAPFVKPSACAHADTFSRWFSWKVHGLHRDDVRVRFVRCSVCGDVLEGGYELGRIPWVESRCQRVKIARVYGANDNVPGRMTGRVPPSIPIHEQDDAG